MTSLKHDLHVRMHPFQAPPVPADDLVWGKFVGKIHEREMIHDGVCLCPWS